MEEMPALYEEWWRGAGALPDLVEKRRMNRGAVRAMNLCSDAAWLAAAERAADAGAPAVLRPASGEPEGGWSGLVVTDGTRYGVLTAAHGLCAAAGPGRPRRRRLLATIPDRVRGPRAPEEAPKGGAAPNGAATMDVIGTSASRPRPGTPSADVGVARLPADETVRMLEESGRRAFDLREAAKRAAALPFAGMHVAVGAPRPRQAGPPGFWTSALSLERRYERNGFAYLGYGANGGAGRMPREARAWRGCSGAPIWQIRPRNGNYEPLLRKGGAVSRGEFEEPLLLGTLAYRRTKNWPEGAGPPGGFEEELYAHQVEGRLVHLAARMLAATDADEDGGSQPALDEAALAWEAERARIRAQPGGRDAEPDALAPLTCFGLDRGRETDARWSGVVKFAVESAAGGWRRPAEIGEIAAVLKKQAPFDHRDRFVVNALMEALEDDGKLMAAFAEDAFTTYELARALHAAGRSTGWFTGALNGRATMPL